jgi:hypothetical protein
LLNSTQPCVPQIALMVRECIVAPNDTQVTT